MQLLFDDDLVEAVVFLCASGRCGKTTSPQARRFHAERERLYRIVDADERSAAFAKLYSEWFREWQIDRLLQDAVTLFPLLTSAIVAVGFRKARERNDEGAELYVNADGKRHAVVTVRPERFERFDRLAAFLNHELLHVSDMIDPAFGYERALYGLSAAHERLIRDRYRLLWNITVDGRLVRARRATISAIEERESEFARAFKFLTPENRAEMFESLWTGDSPRHADLMAIASDPRELNNAHQAVPGAPCPLCGFPAFTWALSDLRSEVIERIVSEFPTWEPAHGICHRCGEVYEAAVSAAAEKA